MILGFSTTVSGSIAYREAGIQPPAQRFRYLWFKRALRCDDWTRVFRNRYMKNA